MLPTWPNDAFLGHARVAGDARKKEFDFDGFYKYFGPNF